MTATQTSAAKLKATLEKTGMPYHEIECYGRQITVECISRDTCAKWAVLLAKFAKVRSMIKSYAYAKETQQHANEREIFDVWRVYASIE